MQKKPQKLCFLLGGYLVHASILVQNPRKERDCIYIFNGGYVGEIVKSLLTV